MIKPCIPEDPVIEAKVEKRLESMTLDEKVGQMCEISIDVLTDMQKSHAEGRFSFDEQAMNEVLYKYKAGSILNVPLSVAQDRETWYGIISEINRHSIKATGIPCVYGVDSNHGASYTLDATFFPQEINQAATFDRNVPYRVGEIAAYESRACDIPWVYNPVMDLERNQAWSRMWESYGEDVYVNSEMAVAAVRGFQGDDPNHIDANHVGVSLKHYMAYGAAENGRDRTPSSITDREMREKFFMPYKRAAEAGALTVMVNSSINDGIPFHANAKFITGWLKDELNWDGMVVTDWSDINNLYLRDHVAADKKDAIKMAINAGIDMSMEPYDVHFCDLLKELVESGDVKMERIDDAVRRILRFKYRLGLFDTPDTKPADYPDFACPRFAEEATRMAEESEVLLKNEGDVLPITKGTKILLTGPNANSMRCLDGGWSYTWQGNRTDEFASAYNTIYEAMCGKFGKDNVILEQGVTYAPSDNVRNGWYYDENEPEIEKAVAAAQDADIIVACIGENSYCETPGVLNDLRLSDNQQNLVKALAKTGKPVVLILNEGRPRLIPYIEPLAKAVVDIMLPGNYGGDALANLLAGDSNFSGRLPFTYPKFPNNMTTYDYKPCENTGTMTGSYNYDAVLENQWNFGFGLSYTTFRYSNLKVNKSEFKAGDVLEFSVDVTNTGEREGDDAVLVFSSDIVASVSPDNSRLRAFERVSLKPGETKTVNLAVKANDLSFVGADGKWILEKGEFRVKCGNLVMNVECTETHRWNTPNID
ncbi:MAG: glycoside hydrolase family 3 C-terminal domain-containing protein [Bacteroidales bacterium]|nr:glycoside hydrolase family 3 C-terminal domain-containing protein [Bacteroidales bacterium]MCI2122025.1 glycoside hydrolase family 3 C-terminal domain-containing protein [Bacteroidales bacterium]MCI2146220.1 glycoside hydrolase family 3 C-terminal domain-containing protein [Bacteroidales bacterium]